MPYRHIVSGLSTVKPTFDYGCGFRHHVEAYWIATKIQVVKTDAPVDDMKYQATLGDYDLDCKIGYGHTAEQAIEDLLMALDDRIR